MRKKYEPTLKTRVAIEAIKGTRTAAEIAKEASVKKLVIGHYSSRYNELGFLLKEAIAVFPDTELANEGKIFEL